MGLRLKANKSAKYKVLLFALVCLLGLLVQPTAIGDSCIPGEGPALDEGALKSELGDGSGIALTRKELPDSVDLPCQTDDEIKKAPDAKTCGTALRICRRFQLEAQVAISKDYAKDSRFKEDVRLAQLSDEELAKELKYFYKPGTSESQTKKFDENALAKSFFDQDIDALFRHRLIDWEGSLGEAESRTPASVSSGADLASGALKESPMPHPVCVFSPKGVVSDQNDPKCNSLKYVHFTASGGYAGSNGDGMKESAWMAGAEISAMRCKMNQVREEIRNGQLKLTNKVCQHMGADTQDLFRDTKFLSKTVSDDLFTEVVRYDAAKKASIVENFCNTSDLDAKTGKKIFKTPELCKGDEGAAQTADEQDPIKKNFVRSCELSYARAGAEKMFHDTARCEVIWRSSKFYGEIFTGSIEAKFNDSAFSAQLAAMANQCHAAAKSHGKRVGRKKKSASAGMKAAVSFFRACYARGYEKTFAGLYATHFNPQNCGEGFTNSSSHSEKEQALLDSISREADLLYAQLEKEMKR